MIVQEVDSGNGFIQVDGVTKYDDKDIAAYLERYISCFHESEFGSRYLRTGNHSQDRRTFARSLPLRRAKCSRATPTITQTSSPRSCSVFRKPRGSRTLENILPQAVYLDYSQERLASYGIQLADLGRVLLARNITLPAGSIQRDRPARYSVDPSDRFEEDARSIGNVIVGASKTNKPSLSAQSLVVQISRAYQSPATYLNFYSQNREARSAPARTGRAITLAVYMRSREQIRPPEATIEEKMKPVHAALNQISSSRPRPISLQMKERYRPVHGGAIRSHQAGRVLIALIGFRGIPALLMALVDADYARHDQYGMAHTVLGIDLQQVSIATLIIALSLLVDNPDSCKRCDQARARWRNSANSRGVEWGRQDWPRVL